jgi:hypothetical protein
MVLTSGEFQSGSAAASAQTASTPAWVTPAGVSGAVKLSRARK